MILYLNIILTIICIILTTFFVVAVYFIRKHGPKLRFFLKGNSMELTERLLGLKNGTGQDPDFRKFMKDELEKLTKRKL